MSEYTPTNEPSRKPQNAREFIGRLLTRFGLSVEITSGDDSEVFEGSEPEENQDKT